MERPSPVDAPRTFLITGASRGIGLATAKLLAQRGHLVIGLARHAPDDFPGVFLTVDLADRTATTELLAANAEAWNLDGVINNVGLVRPAYIEDQTVDDLDAVLDLNLRVAMQVTRAALPAMKAKRFGRIVNVTSVVTAGAPKRTAYAAAKAGLSAFARTWAIELAPYGITANAVAPGPTDTDLYRAANPLDGETHARYMANMPLARLGKPREIAAAIGYFCSDAAGFCTGQTLYVDGGGSLG